MIEDVKLCKLVNKSKKLFKVTCNSQFDTLPVYVIAEDETMASELALKKMRDISYSFTRYVSHIELLADTNLYGPKILVLD